MKSIFFQDGYRKNQHHTYNWNHSPSTSEKLNGKPSARYKTGPPQKEE